MTFELETFTKSKLLDVVVLSQKNRNPDENPGAKLSFEMDMSNNALSMFNGHLKSFLFEKRPGDEPGQKTLDGVEPVSDKPNLTGIGAKVGVLHWSHDLTGYDLTIDLGLGGKKSNLEIGDCTLSGWLIHPKEGGTVQIKFNIESSDVSESAFGKLAKLKSCETMLMLTPPDVEQEEIGD